MYSHLLWSVIVNTCGDVHSIRHLPIRPWHRLHRWTSKHGNLSHLSIDLYKWHCSISRFTAYTDLWSVRSLKCYKYEKGPLCLDLAVGIGGPAKRFPTPNGPWRMFISGPVFAPNCGSLSRSPIPWKSCAGFGAKGFSGPGIGGQCLARKSRASLQ